MSISQQALSNQLSCDALFSSASLSFLVQFHLFNKIPLLSICYVATSDVFSFIINLVSKTGKTTLVFKYYGKDIEFGGVI